MRSSLFPAAHAAPPAYHWGDSAAMVDIARGADPADLVRVAGHAARRLPADVHDALVDFSDVADRSGALVLRGVPVGDVPPTPGRPTEPTAKDLTSELSLLAVARRLGQPVGYAPEHGGDIVQNIVPVRTSSHRQVSTSSRRSISKGSVTFGTLGHG